LTTGYEPEMLLVDAHAKVWCGSGEYTFNHYVEVKDAGYYMSRDRSTESSTEPPTEPSTEPPTACLFLLNRLLHVSLY
jgi:hypothetical protein